MPTKEGSFVLVSGKCRFNRSLYGTHTAFRVEAGDLPEFAMYLPGMGGNLSFVMQDNKQHKKLINADFIQTTYTPGRMQYQIKDSFLRSGAIHLTIFAMAKDEGLIVKWHNINVPKGVKLYAIFGGVSGKNFSRNGDIGADPESSFYLKDSNCLRNYYNVDKHHFILKYLISKNTGDNQTITGLASSASWRITDAKYITGNFSDTAVTNPVFPVVYAYLNNNKDEGYIIVKKVQTVEAASFSFPNLSSIYNDAEKAADSLNNRVVVRTPDAFINCLGGALSTAADGIWESPAFMHGAVAWRMPLNGWRGPYAADALGWHNRAETYFNAYALSQLKEPSFGSVMPDTLKNFAKQKEKIGSAVYSAGYIGRYPGGRIALNHYDMNLVFIDQLITHFNYTGDTSYVRKMWNLLKLHLAWEKRNFDADNDGLYDAYACIWASDALQYSGGDVSYSSAYNYRANKMAAYLASLIGESPVVYQQEADKIFSAFNKNLWLKKYGSYAEYKEVYGAKNVHPDAGLWTFYHIAESGLPDKFQAYQESRYADEKIPHIPVKVKELPRDNLYLLSTTDWQPYTWSVNNVALAENLHAALAYWQSGNLETAYELWRSSLIESMFMSAAPGNFEQLSAYDAMRGELYRDFADPIGMAARSLTEGLFGIYPKALSNELYIRPGFPKEWGSASLKTPDIKFLFRKKNDISNYIIKPNYPKRMSLTLDIPMYQSNIESVFVNGKMTDYKIVESISNPVVSIIVPYAACWNIQIKWSGSAISRITKVLQVHYKDSIKIPLSGDQITGIKDPQSIVSAYNLIGHQVLVSLNVEDKDKTSGTFFLHIKQGRATWWQPINLEFIQLGKADVHPTGANKAIILINMDIYFNDRVTHIFNKQYFTPRPNVPTLQLPVQGVGNWCYPDIHPEINDEGLWKVAEENKGIINIGDSIKFRLSGRKDSSNIAFTSLWDCYPDSVSFPLKGSANGIALLMAGTTNPMQSQLQNGIVVIKYTDNSTTDFSLQNPETWYPIEQDYFNDRLAFRLKQVLPVRIHLKTGKAYYGFANHYTTIKGYSDRIIDGGAATVLIVKTDASKVLQSLTVKTTANDVVVGVMAVSLIR